MTKVVYRATRVLPVGVPVALVARRGEVTVLISDGLTIEEACAALTPLITAHAADWPGQAIA